MPLTGQLQRTVCADKENSLLFACCDKQLFWSSGAIYLGADCHINTAGWAGTRDVVN